MLSGKGGGNISKTTGGKDRSKRRRIGVRKKINLIHTKRGTYPSPRHSLTGGEKITKRKKS